MGMEKMVALKLLGWGKLIDTKKDRENWKGKTKKPHLGFSLSQSHLIVVAGNDIVP